VPPKLKRISGHDLVRVFENLGFYMVSQKGSHIKLRRETESGAQILIIPDHRELDRGTLFSIYRKPPLTSTIPFCVPSFTRTRASTQVKPSMRNLFIKA
jgi:predicted RNA binding protein YcfA (HicA-like mRNA interferase family)